MHTYTYKVPISKNGIGIYFTFLGHLVKAATIANFSYYNSIKMAESSILRFLYFQFSSNCLNFTCDHYFTITEVITFLYFIKNLRTFNLS